MRYYTKILSRENKRRLAKVFTFRNLVIEYYNNCKIDTFEAIENDRARQLRREINTSLDEVAKIVHAVGISTTRLYSPSPIRGGYAGPVDTLSNIFQLPFLQIKPNVVIDELERAWGIYNGNQRAAKVRLFNPFYYLAWLLDLVAEIPFALLGALGFNRGKAEVSPLGRAAKLVFKLVAFIAALLTVLYHLGLMDGIRNAIFSRT